MSLNSELYGTPMSVSKLESKSVYVDSPNRRNPKMPVIA